MKLLYMEVKNIKNLQIKKIKRDAWKKILVYTIATIFVTGMFIPTFHSEFGNVKIYQINPIDQPLNKLGDVPWLDSSLS